MNEQLERLGSRFWDLALESSPMWASLLGDHRFDAEVEDLSREREDALIEALGGIADQTAAIDPINLDRQDRIGRAVLLAEVEGIRGSLQSRMAEITVDPMLGIHMDIIQGIPQLRAMEDAHAWAFVEKASKVGRLFDQAIERHRQGVASGRTPPRISVEKVIGQLDAYAALPMNKNPFLQITLPESWDDLQRQRWRNAMAEQITDSVTPGFARYREAVAGEILPAARPPERSGVCWLPDGEEVYRRAVHRYTSLDLDAADVHRIGLDEIGALEDEYRDLGAKVLGTDDIPIVYDRLRNDPDLRFRTAEEVHQAAESALQRARQAVPDWFGRLPEAPCIVQPVPEVGAEDTTIAYYFPPADDGSRPGIFFINLSQPETRTRFESEALAFHESIPGHHLQLALAQELEGLPSYRRHALMTAYTEGWGLYTERLSEEMGLYSGDLERMGVLAFDSWRAGRLVVDTGLHAMGWSRRQAIEYLEDNSPLATNNIANEVDRYIGYVGQALAYKIGQREIFRQRKMAEEALGSSFDIKGFHDAVLESGAVPLEVLGDLVTEWVESQSTPSAS
ncbi:MAG: DUF885 domain-containing protein [Acidimicrobiia bacterium]|nr:MAG: DUF885 domain-containing protein [Acidimicrobiia bacterium]